MTLLDMANFVCAKVRQSDALAVTRCKEFLRRRYEMIYADQLWRASLYTHHFSVPNALVLDFTPNITTTGEEGMYFMPELVDRVLAVRADDAQVDVIDELMLYRGSLNQYEEEGDATKFSILSPAIFWVASPNLDNMPAQFSGLDTNETLTVRWIDGQDIRHTTVVTAASGAAAFATPDEDGVKLIETVTHAALAGNIVLQFDEGDTGAFQDVGRSVAGDLGFTPRQRIRIYPKPGNGAAARGYEALVKRKLIPLTDDNDVPMLTGIENCLMSLAQADMLQRSRQYGKAQIVQAEADGLFDQFKRLEVVQQANRMQILPEVTEPSGSIGWRPSKGYI